MSFNPIGVGLNALNLLHSSLLNPRQIGDFQESRFRQLIAYAYQHSGFYQKKYHGIDLGAAFLSSLPVVNKMDLMKHFDSWVCDPEVDLVTLKAFISKPSNVGNLYLDKYVVWESSGSSGVPAMFLQDSDAMDVYDALQGIRQARSSFLQHAFDPFLLSQKVALVAAVDGHFASNVSFERAKATRPQSASSFKSISIMGSLAEVIDELNQCSPTIIATYPTTAVILADAIQDGSLKVSPQEIWTGGETLTLKMREHINHCFHVNVRHSYGASEFFEIAWECDFGHLHVNSDWVILEAVDDQNRPVPPGVMSHSCLLTNLANRVQPIIRYDLGDSIRYHKEECLCGSNLPCIDVLGRADDVLQVAGDHGDLIPLMPLAITTALEEDAGVFDFQIKQKNASCLIVRIPRRSNHGISDMHKCIAAMRSYLGSQGASCVQLIEEPNTKLTVGKSGKIKRVMS